MSQYLPPDDDPEERAAKRVARGARRKAKRIAYVEFDATGSTTVFVPMKGRYLHFDGVMAWLTAEADAWDAAAENEPGTYPEPPEVCRAVADTLRGIAERPWSELA